MVFREPGIDERPDRRTSHDGDGPVVQMSPTRLEFEVILHRLEAQVWIEWTIHTRSRSYVTLQLFSRKPGVEHGERLYRSL